MFLLEKTARAESPVSFPGEGRTYRPGKHTVRFKITGEQTNGDFSLADGEVPPGDGVPPHVHRYEDETFYILEGKFEVMVDGKTYIAEPGASVFAPRNVPHSWYNVGDDWGRMLAVFTPGRSEAWFAALDELNRTDPGNIAKMIDVLGAYGIEPAFPIEEALTAR